MPPYAATVERVQTTGGHSGQMRETLRRIGQAIRAASVYPPIRNHAAAVASTAPPKNFLGQLQAVYSDFTKRWRYVKDPVSKELLTSSPEAIWRLTMGGDGIGVGAGYGAGDCDCVTTALGAVVESIGFKTRLGTTAPRRSAPGKLFGHVFIQAYVPKFGWITLDPVLHPKKRFGAVADHSRIAFWDLDGNFLGARGNFTGLGQTEENTMLGNISDDNMWPDYGFGGADPEPDAEPVEWSYLGLSNWGWMDTPQGKVSTVAQYGVIPGEMLGFGVEVDANDEWDYGTVRTPMIELSLDDYAYVNANGKPYDGMLGLGDTGEIYYYDGLGGFFKKLRRKIKKKVKKVAKRIKGKVKKVLKKSKFGRALLKVGGKIKKIAMKVVKPLVKFVGKYAAKLAPIAALIPGFGPAIAGGLMVAGKVAKMMTKFGVKTTGAAGAVRSLALKDPRKLGAFKKALTHEAKRMKAFSKAHPKRFKRLSTRLAR